MAAILDGVKGHLVVWVIVSLVGTGIEHLFLCLLAFCVSSLDKYLFKSFAHYLS